MKIQKILSLLFAASSLLASCSNDFDLGTIFSGSVSEVNVSIADADYTETINTRSSHSVDPSRGFVTTWTEGDTIGVYPIGADQVAFPISGGEGSSTASFDGGAWSLRASRQYGAYYPFSKKNYYIDETRIPISYLGQKQTGDNNLDHLSDYDFMAAAAVSPDANGAVNMTMRHLGAFLRLTITAPEAKTYTKLRLSSDAAIFTTDATINLQDGSLTPTKKADVLSLLLDNVTTTAPNQTITAYMMLAPISASDISAHPISVTLFDDNGVSYVADLSFTSIVAGKSYAKSASVVLDGFDDSMIEISEPSIEDYLHVSISGIVKDASILKNAQLLLECKRTDTQQDNEEDYVINVNEDGTFSVDLANGNFVEVYNGSNAGVYSFTKFIPGKEYYCRLKVITDTEITKYGSMKTFIAPQFMAKPISIDGVNHTVDLGLSVRWCSENVGVQTSYSEYGNFYAWGEIEPKSNYSEETYKWCDGGYINIGKNISGNPLYDPSVSYHGGSAGKRMPTAEEWCELVEKCDWYWTSLDGVDGFQIFGSNGNNIFLPYHKHYLNNAICECPECDYWSATALPTLEEGVLGGEYSAYGLSFGVVGSSEIPSVMAGRYGGVGYRRHSGKYHGLMIRSVSDY